MLMEVRTHGVRSGRDLTARAAFLLCAAGLVAVSSMGLSVRAAA